MLQATELTPAPQRLRALERANEIRLARAELKRRIASGEISAADVIVDCPPEASSWPLGDLLLTQRRWGGTRCRRFLARNQISEIKPIGTLTERQRRLLAQQLRAAESPSRSHLSTTGPSVSPELILAAQAVPERALALVVA